MDAPLPRVPKPDSLIAAEGEVATLDVERRNLIAQRDGISGIAASNTAATGLSVTEIGEARVVLRAVLADLRNLEHRETAARLRLNRELELYRAEVTRALLPRWRSAEQCVARSHHNLLQSWAELDQIAAALRKAGAEPRVHVSADVVARLLLKIVNDALGRPHGEHSRAA